MTTPPLDLPALRDIASAVEMFDDEWTALGTGPAGGDHWYICNDGESIASVSCQDGINEAEREPIAAHIAAFDPPTVLALLDRVEKAERACQTLGRVIDRQCEDALTATDSQDLMWGNDGDGDWGAIWERVLGLGEKAREATARAEAAERDLAAVREHCESAEWMADDNGDQWEVVTVGVLFNAIGAGA